MEPVCRPVSCGHVRDLGETGFMYFGGLVLVASPGHPAWKLLQALMDPQLAEDRHKVEEIWLKESL
jgi:hypothetical protein